MKRIVFICTGNTCRSPMAEMLFRAHGGEEKTGLRAESAGIFTQDGMQASGHAQTVAANRGGDLSAHKSRQITDEIVENAAYLVCMTAAHYDAMLERFPYAEDKLFMLADMDIADPFGGGLKIYEETADEINEAIVALIDRLKV